MKNHAAFTVDVEDGVSLSMRDYYGQKIPMTDRVVTNTSRILDLLGEHNTLGTFFILGSVGEVFPDLVQRIAKEGHEIGVHGHDHYKFTEMTRDKAFSEVSRAKKVLEDLTGCEVLGHRAPEFSISAGHPWAFEVLSEAGFLYDASINPAAGAELLAGNGQKGLYPIGMKSGETLYEFPLSISCFLGKRIPACGGRYFQALPYALNARLFRQALVEGPTVFYMHPYEIDLEPYPEVYQKAFRQASVKKKLRRHTRWIGKKRNFDKISRLLQDFRFQPMKEILQLQFPEIKRDSQQA